ncbi:hypothetical protein GCM10017562_75320 [Streptomyces roseofulvus]|uniref:hypothetical protein n=1 Tax=Streptomyces roseofulvus TaxID=33902 RepID=UPI0031FC8B89
MSPRRAAPLRGYVPVAEDDFVHPLLDTAICKALAVDDPYAVDYDRAHPDGRQAASRVRLRADRPGV